MANRRQAFENILKVPVCGVPAPVFDPLSVRIAEELGYNVALLAGSSASLQVLGAPDLSLVTLSELAEQTRRITRVSRLPLLVDADHGFGNALNVIRTVEELAGAGAAALTIEDTALPAAFGRAEAREVISVGEAVGKLRAACHAGQRSSIAIVARTDISVTGLEDGIARIGQYSEEPVSAVFVSGVKSRGHLQAISAATHLPLILGAIPEDMQDCEYLATQRARLFNRGHQPVMASIQAVYDAMAELRGGPGSRASVPLASPETLDRLSNKQRYGDWIASFL